MLRGWQSCSLNGDSSTIVWLIRKTRHLVGEATPELVVLHAPASKNLSLRDSAESAGRLWVVLPARLPRS
jgi:hypothetical protein